MGTGLCRVRSGCDWRSSQSQSAGTDASIIERRPALFFLGHISPIFARIFAIFSLFFPEMAPSRLRSKRPRKEGSPPTYSWWIGTRTYAATPTAHPALAIAAEQKRAIVLFSHSGKSSSVTLRAFSIDGSKGRDSSGAFSRSKGSGALPRPARLAAPCASPSRAVLSTGMKLPRYTCSLRTKTK